MIIPIGIGIAIGVLFGAAAVWILDRRHQKTIEKLVESRRKIERQRTQAVNDLFAFRAEAGNGPITSEVAAATATGGGKSNEELVGELESLRALVARADAALGSARVQRDAQDAEISELRGQIEVLTEDRAEVISLHPSPPNTNYNVNYGRV